MCNPEVRKAHHLAVIFSLHCISCGLVTPEKLHFLALGLIISKIQTKILGHNPGVFFSRVSYVESLIGQWLTLQMCSRLAPGTSRWPACVLAIVALGLLRSQFWLFLWVDVVTAAAWFGLVSLFICSKNVRMLILKPR